MQALADAGCRTFLEIGPSATLIGMGQKCLGAGYQWLASARAEMPAYTIIRQSQAALYAAGYDLAWKKIYAGKGRHHVPLPGYPLPRKHYWFFDECSTEDTAGSSPTGVSTEQTAALSVCELLQKFIVEVTDGAIKLVKSDDAFFSLGLNSLQWMQIHNRLQECYTEEIPITLVFLYPTIGELAEYLDNEFANSRV
jgi:acyl transferase domain-containing protein